MASIPSIPNFGADAVRAGLRTAMYVGLPPLKEAQPTFFFPSTPVTTGALTDQEGVPFTSGGTVTRTPLKPSVQVPCAVEYVDGDGKLENFGVVAPSKVKLTLLDEDYAQVQGFLFCVIGPNRYYYRRTEAPTGLITIGLYTVHCYSEDEG